MMQRAPRALSQLGALSRRLLHSGGSARDASFSVPLPIPRAAGLSGMDMSRAPGYAVAADQPPPASSGTRLSEFAQRHGRLAHADIAHADGYLWVGPVIYPAGTSAAHFSVSWDDAADACVEPPNDDVEPNSQYHHHRQHNARRMYHTKRRYTGGQARRIRQQRQESILRRARRKAPSKPSRKPKNDLPPVEEEA